MSSSKTIMIYIWDMGIGGVQKRVRDILHYLNQNYPHYRLELLIKRAYPTPLLSQVKEMKHVRIHYFSTFRGKIWFPSFFWLAYQYWSIKPNVVLTFMDRLSIQLAFFKKVTFWHKVKLIINESIHTSTYLKMYENWFWEKLVKIFYPLANLIIVPTQAIKNDLCRNFDISQKKVMVVPHWILDNAHKGKFKKVYDFIYIGRLEKEKNIFWLLSLVCRLKIISKNDVTLCILGEGKLAKSLKEKIAERKLTRNVFLIGFKKNTSLYLSKSKILLLPSANEGMPNCVLEAAIYKVPSIINNFAGANEIVRHQKTGLIIHNQGEFYKAARQLLASPKFCQKLGLCALENTLNNYGKNNLVEFVDKLINTDYFGNGRKDTYTFKM